MGEPQLTVARSVGQAASLATSRVASFRDAVMGYNHQIPHRGRVFHVQSEDSGPAKSHIFTHVFLSGTIVASSRIDYGSSMSSSEIGDLLKKSQKSMLHRLVCGALDEKIARCLGCAEVRGISRLEIVPAPSAELEPLQDSRDSAESEALHELLEQFTADVSGVLLLVAVDVDRGTCIGKAGTGLEIDVDVVVAGSVSVLEAQRAAMRSLGQADALEDMLITTQGQYHIIRPVSEKVSLYLVIDRAAGNLALARHKLGAASIDPRIDRA